MQSEQQHIDDFIRNNSEEYNPDQRDMQANWQQMRSTLSKPPGKFRITKTRKLIKYVGGIALVTVITITLIQLNNKKNIIATKQVETKASAVIVKPASDLKNNTVAVVNNKNASKAAPVKTTAPKSPTKKQLPKKTIKPNPVKKHADPTIALSPETKKVKKPDPLLMLEQFYAELKKTPEEFFISADRDTVLKAKEGTRLTIPSKTFDKKTGTIKIILTEFYSDEDMITGKLSTTSNGNQLVTGGMLNIRAEADGQPVKIAPDKAITLEMPTKKYDEKMQLYTGSFSESKEYSYLAYNEPKDTVAIMRIDGSTEMINWIPAGQEQSLFGSNSPRLFKVPDIAGEPYKVRYGKKITATFLISRDLEMSNKEVKERLKRYSLFYDKIRVRRLIFGPNFLRFGKEEPPVIKGDSITMKFESAVRLNLVSKEDSIRYRRLLYQDSVQNETRRKYLSNYRFEVVALGWINCDRMYESPGPRVEYTIKLGEGVEAGNFVTQLVFTKYRSMVPGFYAGDKIQFRSVPLDEPVHLVAVGVIDGKVVSCIKSLNVTREEVTGLSLEETDAKEFKEKVNQLLKSIPR